jgi:hypothetical protein
MSLDPFCEYTTWAKPGVRAGGVRFQGLRDEDDPVEDWLVVGLRVEL